MTSPDALYSALVAGANRLRLRRLTYRCSRRCLLLDAIAAPQGVIVHLNECKVSAERVASGRAVRRRWGSRTFDVDISTLRFRGNDAAHWLLVQCDHTEARLGADEFWGDWESTRSTVTLPRVTD